MRLEDLPFGVLIRSMRYLWQFLPSQEDVGGKRPMLVPFSVSVAPCGEAFRLECQKSQAWEAITHSHPAWDEEDLPHPIVVVQGTRQFFEVLASKVRPLGQLANEDGFERCPYLLQLFCQQLNVLTENTICFFLGGDECSSDYRDVAASLSAGLVMRMTSERGLAERLLECLNTGYRQDLSSFFYERPTHLLIA